MPKKIVLIGAGRVAFHLAQKLCTLPHYEVVQVFSRHLETAQDLITCTPFTNEVEAINDLSKVEREADCYIFSLVDSALDSVWSQMPPTKGIWLHTAGSVSIQAMADYHQKSAVLYPMQTFSKEREIDWSNVPIYLETLADIKAEVEALALDFSKNVHWLSSEGRAKLHCSAVFACNFSNHLVALAEELLAEEGIETKALLPLLEETFAKLQPLPAKQAQTGPAIRRDENTMNAHLKALSDKPKLKEIYQILSKSIQEL